MTEIHFANHYDTIQLDGIESLKEIFSEGTADERNWCFVGTSGVHGWSTKLDAWPDTTTFTVLVVQPRLVVCYYGEVEIETEDELEWLRSLVESSLEAIEKSQTPNLDES